MNKYTGQSIITLDGKACILCYDWSALSKIKSIFTDTIWQNLNGIDPLVLAELIAIGLEKHNPEITKDTVISLSPPLIESINAVDRAVGLAYFGPDAMPKEQETVAKKKKKRTIFVMLFVLLSISALALTYFFG